MSSAGVMGRRPADRTVVVDGEKIGSTQKDAAGTTRLSSRSIPLVFGRRLCRLQREGTTGMKKGEERRKKEE